MSPETRAAFEDFKRALGHRTAAARALAKADKAWIEALEKANSAVLADEAAEETSAEYDEFVARAAAP